MIELESKDVEQGVSTVVSKFSDHIRYHPADLNFYMLRVQEKIVLKARKDGEFHQSPSDTKLFRGYNGLDTAYAVFHKPS